MLPKRGNTLPIALLTDKIGTAVTWVLNHHSHVEKYETGQNRIVADNIEYVIITRKEQLLALEISDYKDVGGHQRPSSFYLELADEAKKRIRRIH